MSKGSVAEMVPTGKKPAAILRIYEESLGRTDVLLLGDGEYLRGAVAGGGLPRSG